MPLFRRSKDREPEREPELVVPPVDLDVPLTNPELLDAIRNYATERTPANERLMQQSFNRATFLATVDFSESTFAPAASGTPGQSVLLGGSRFTLHTALWGEGVPLLAVFSDWDAVRTWTDRPVQGLVLPAADVISLGLKQFEGVVLNPGGPSLGLNHATLRMIRAAGTG